MGLFRATRYVASLPLVDVDGLVAQGVRLVLLDRDNTCVPRDAKAAPAEVAAWLVRAREAGLELCLVSNNFHTSHVSRTARERRRWRHPSMMPWFARQADRQERVDTW